MKDLHNHLIYDVDDGSTSLENSCQILKHLEEIGITDILLTPHYIIGTNYNASNEEKKKKLKLLQKETKIKLYLGNEIYLDEDILSYLQKGEISSINNTSYLLVEFPLQDKLNNIQELLFHLRQNGYIPIIAHPERYHYMSLEEMESLVNSGCLLQGNITSLEGKYGSKAKNNLLLLLKKNMIHVLGTDLHQHGNVDLEKCLNILKKIVDEKMYQELTEINFDKIINGKKIEKYPIVVKRKFLIKERIR